MDRPHRRTRPGVPRREWMRRLAWLVALWLGGVLTLGAVAYVIRVFMHALGMR
ncbi:DUF2474 domain-containing protein [Massilia sp. UMI-21]|nr:DUF2474 domain-containing protein [Massilia sp. UMI-21]